MAMMPAVDGSSLASQTSGVGNADTGQDIMDLTEGVQPWRPGAAKARAVAAPTLDEVNRIVGFWRP